MHESLMPESYIAIALFIILVCAGILMMLHSRRSDSTTTDFLHTDPVHKSLAETLSESADAITSDDPPVPQRWRPAHRKQYGLKHGRQRR